MQGQDQELLAQKVARLRPVQPTGLFAAFKQKAYETDLSRWWQRTRYVEKLGQQSAQLNGQLETAKITAWQWSEKVVAKNVPELFSNVQRYLQEQRRKQLEKQWTEQDRQRLKNRDQGRGK